MKGIKTFFIIFFVSILLTIFVKADCNITGIDWYIDFDNNANDSTTNNRNPTSQSYTHTTSGCKLGGCATFNGVNQYIEYNDFLDLWNNVTIGIWIKRDTDSGGYERILHKTADTLNDYTFGLQLTNSDVYQVVQLPTTGALNSLVDTTNIKGAGQWTYVVYTWDKVNMRIFLNGTLKSIAPKTFDTLYNDVEKWNIGRLYAGSWLYGFNGKVDELLVIRKNLTYSQISGLYNGGLGCNPFNVTIGDTTPPTITFNSQTPSNISTTNTISIGLKINYTITDGTGVDTTTIRMNMTVNNSYYYFDGTKYNMKYNQKYTSNSGTMYQFFFDDNKIYNGIYLINESIMETTTHNIYTLTNANNWMKLTYKNVSKYKSYSFYESMTENATSTLCNLQLYYCNSSYTNGNPVSSPYCAVFFDGINTNVYNHTHGSKSKHKVYPLAISTDGKVNNIGVSPTSYILYRGNNLCNQNIYYVNYTYPANIVQTSNNNGNTWTTLTNKFPDAHLHQISGNKSESINYRVKACDTLGNCGYSLWRSDILELTNLNPTPVNILNPKGNTYLGNVPININYTSCNSPQLTPINRYLIQYYPYGSSTITTIVSNNYPNLNYLWTVSSLSSGNYQIKITCFDSSNKNSSSTSEIFTITSYTDLLLLGINISNSLIANYINSVNNSVTDINEGNEMIAIVFLYIALMVIGYWLTLTGNQWIGLPFLLSTVGFSFYFWQYWESDSTKMVLGYMFAGLTLGSIFMWLFIKTRRQAIMG